MVNYFFEDCKEKDLDTKKISNWIERVVNQNNFTLGELSFIFCSDSYLLDINIKHLNHDYYTDVITFDYTESGIISGDIFISLDRVQDNAKQFKELFDYELSRIIIHGVLHLIGFNDKTKEEKNIMTSKEDEYLNLLNDVE